MQEKCTLTPAWHTVPSRNTVNEPCLFSSYFTTLDLRYSGGNRSIPLGEADGWMSFVFLEAETLAAKTLSDCCRYFQQMQNLFECFPSQCIFFLWDILGSRKLRWLWLSNCWKKHGDTSSNRPCGKVTLESFDNALMKKGTCNFVVVSQWQ